jgi:hypothetical protein
VDDTIAVIFASLLREHLVRELHWGEDLAGLGASARAQPIFGQRLLQVYATALPDDLERIAAVVQDGIDRLGRGADPLLLERLRPAVVRGEASLLRDRTAFVRRRVVEGPWSDPAVHVEPADVAGLASSLDADMLRSWAERHLPSEPVRWTALRGGPRLGSLFGLWAMLLLFALPLRGLQSRCATAVRRRLSGRASWIRRAGSLCSVAVAVVALLLIFGLWWKTTTWWVPLAAPTPLALAEHVAALLPAALFVVCARVVLGVTEGLQ